MRCTAKNQNANADTNNKNKNTNASEFRKWVRTGENQLLSWSRFLNPSVRGTVQVQVRSKPRFEPPSLRALNVICEMHIITDEAALKHVWLDLPCYDSMIELEREEDEQDEKKVKKEVRLRWNHISRVSHSKISNFPAKLLIGRYDVSSTGPMSFISWPRLYI